MKRFFSLIVLLFILSVDIFSQSYDDQYREFVKQRNTEFQEWRTKANNDFYNFLKEAWADYTVSLAREDPIGALPDKPTYYKGHSKRHNLKHGLPSSGEFALPATLPKDIDYFGVEETIPFDESIYVTIYQIKEESIADAWNSMSKGNFLPTIDTLTALQNRYSLNDWALFSLIKSLTDNVYDDNHINEKIFTQCFLLCQLQYKARVGHIEDNLVLLLPFAQEIYQKSYISDKGVDYYIFSYQNIASYQEDVSTFSKDFSASDKVIDLSIKKPMSIGGQTSYKSVKLNKWQSIIGSDSPIFINEPSVLVSLEYPQTDLSLYYSSVVNNVTSKSVIQSIKIYFIKNKMDKLGALSFLLDLVQNGFDYKTDMEMFGRSKSLFVEESLYYGANNCKDRVVLFSWLIKNTINWNVIWLGYQGHISCAVEIPEDVNGDFIMHNGKKYVICDPTYIGAPIGEAMPKYKDIQPAIIDI